MKDKIHPQLFVIEIYKTGWVLLCYAENRLTEHYQEFIRSLDGEWEI